MIRTLNDLLIVISARAERVRDYNFLFSEKEDESSSRGWGWEMKLPKIDQGKVGRTGEGVPFWNVIGAKGKRRSTAGSAWLALVYLKGQQKVFSQSTKASGRPVSLKAHTVEGIAGTAKHQKLFSPTERERDEGEHRGVLPKRRFQYFTKKMNVLAHGELRVPQRERTKQRADGGHINTQTTITQRYMLYLVRSICLTSAQPYKWGKEGQKHTGTYKGEEGGIQTGTKPGTVGPMQSVFTAQQ